MVLKQKSLQEDALRLLPGPRMLPLKVGFGTDKWMLGGGKGYMTSLDNPLISLICPDSPAI